MGRLLRLIVYALIGLGVFLVYAPDSLERATSGPVTPGRFEEGVLKLPVRPPMSEYHAPRGQFATATFPLDGVERRWHWIPPDGAGPSPAIVLLHGSGRNGAAMLDMAKSLAAKGYFLIAPDSADPEGWSGAGDGAAFIDAVLQQAEAVHPIDRGRLFLIGHSAGAIHALWLGNRGGRLWQGVAVHAAALSPREIVGQAEAPPVLIVVGDRDANFPVESVRATAVALAEAGHDVRLEIVPGHDHWFYVIGPRFARHAEAFLRDAARLAD